MVRVTMFLLIVILALSSTQGNPNEIPNPIEPPAPIQVHFVLSARDLPQTEILPSDHPDGYVEVVYYRSEGSRPSFVEKTEVVDNSHNPEWRRIFGVKYIEGQKQKLKFTILDQDTLGKDDNIGTVEVSLREIVNATGCKFAKPIVGYKSETSGYLIINCMINLQIKDETVLRLRNARYEQWPTNFATPYVIND